jgi:hypothetical protein
MVFLVLALWGGVMVIGTYRRWPLFTGGWYGRSLQKRYSTKFAVAYTYAIGAWLIAFGVVAFVWSKHYWGN